MKIKIIRGTICDGRPVDAGTMIETDEAQARTLIALQKAEPVRAEVEKATARPAKKENAAGKAPAKEE